MIEILLSGASGRLCSAVARLAKERDDVHILAGVEIAPCDLPFPVYASFEEVPTVPDVIIDCSHHSTISALLSYAKAHFVPVVVCTTGHTEEEAAMIRQAAKDIPVLKSQNMSLGINVLVDLVKRAASILGDEYDIEIIEAHHNKKLDAPSGTAYMLAEAAKSVKTDAEFVYGRHDVRQARDKREIGISSIRGGTVVGEHEVIFAGLDEVIKISHSAGSRDLFAVGALKAAVYLCGKEAGFYTMEDVCRE